MLVAVWRPVGVKVKGLVKNIDRRERQQMTFRPMRHTCGHPLRHRFRRTFSRLRLIDRWGQTVANFAVLAKLLDFEPELAALKRRSNPFALVTAAHLSVWQDINEIERKAQMKYVTSVERLTGRIHCVVLARVAPLNQAPKISAEGSVMGTGCPHRPVGIGSSGRWLSRRQ